MPAGKKRKAAGKAAPEWAHLRLPPLHMPVVRNVSTDPPRRRLSTSDGQCMSVCLAECRRTGGPLQYVCESLCAISCGT